MTRDLEAEYNNRARVPEHPAIMAGWTRDARSYRDRAPHVAGLAYGTFPRETYDYFPAANETDGPVALFIHGGYWQALSGASFSHMAAGPNALGMPAAVMSYDLCPDVTVADIVAQVRACALTLWRSTGRRVIAYGHSAGGHLAAMLLATDWARLDADAPADLVLGALTISGLFELAPLVPTSVNIKLGLTESEAARLSPALMTPLAGTRLIAAVGGAESGEYLRQSRLIAERWAAMGCTTDYVEIAGANHFTVIAGLADARSALTQALLSLR